MSRSGNRRTRQVLQVLCSVGLLAVLLWLVNPGQVAESISGADSVLLAGALVLAFANRVLMAVKWNVLARSAGVKVPWLTAVNVYFTATFAGIFLPPTIGGDAVRTLILSRRYSRTAEIISSIIVERVLGLLVLALFGMLAVAILALLFADRVPAARSIAIVMALSTIVLFLAVTLLTRPAFYAWVSRGIEKLRQRGGFWSRHADLIDNVRLSCASFNERPSAAVTFSLLTVLEKVLAIFRAWVVAVAFGVTVDPLLFFVVIPVENFVSRLPVSFDGFGLREGVFLSALSLFGVPPATSLAVGLVYHVLFIVAVLPGAWFLATQWQSVISTKTDSAERPVNPVAPR